MKNKKGFTLAELLIVVAIIAVLVAISFPIFSSELEKSREVTDLANIRSAYAEAMAMAYSSADGIGWAYTDYMKSNGLEVNEHWDYVDNKVAGITLEDINKGPSNLYPNENVGLCEVIVHIDGKKPEIQIRQSNPGTINGFEEHKAAGVPYYDLAQ